MSFFKQKDVFTSLSDIGLIRKNNEDAVLTINHPRNKKIKLLAVADGMGGLEDGEVASHFVTQALKKWFVNENALTFSSTLLTARTLYQTIIDINNALFKQEAKKSGCGTTLTCAIVTEKDTIIANIGDSRAYSVHNGEVTQLTRDDSLVWYYYEHGKLSKDDMRFHNQSSVITKCVGRYYNTKPIISRISNNNYDGLLLFTDGVTDCLSDEKIKFLVHSGEDKDIASRIIYEAVHQKQSDIVPKGDYFRDVINGKDNASVALYMKSIQN